MAIHRCNVTIALQVNAPLGQLRTVRRCSLYACLSLLHRSFGGTEGQSRQRPQGGRFFGDVEAGLWRAAEPLHKCSAGAGGFSLFVRFERQRRVDTVAQPAPPRVVIEDVAEVSAEVLAPPPARPPCLVNP